MFYLLTFGLLDHPGAAALRSRLAENEEPTLLLTNQRWDQSVELLQRFRSEFPAHKFNSDVTAKLALALKALESLLQ